MATTLGSRSDHGAMPRTLIQTCMNTVVAGVHRVQMSDDGEDLRDGSTGNRDGRGLIRPEGRIPISNAGSDRREDSDKRW
jgi:hypothetical protein